MSSPSREPVNGYSVIVFVLYLLTLLWLILFKFSYDIPSVLATYQTRSVNWVPFVTFGQTGLSETVLNLVTFIPFGLLLSITFKDASLWRLLSVVLVFSVAVETLQFVFAIGTTDVTDVVTNTVGGLAGLVLYRLLGQVIKTTTLDRVITVIGLVVFVAFMLLRLLVLKVRY